MRLWKPARPSDPKRHRRGFSLTELAVVLAVGGIIVGGVWLYAGQVMDSSKVSLLQTYLTATVNAARQYASGRAGFPGASAAALTQSLVQAKVIPPALIRASTTGCTNTGGVCADSPWGWLESPGAVSPTGTFAVCGYDMDTHDCGTNANQNLQYVAITISGLNRNRCLRIATQTTGPNGPTGLAEVFISGTGIVYIGHSLPVASADANAYCSRTVNNTITNIYRIRAPQ